MRIINVCNMVVFEWPVKARPDHRCSATRRSRQPSPCLSQDSTCQQGADGDTGVHDVFVHVAAGKVGVPGDQGIEDGAMLIGGLLPAAEAIQRQITRPLQPTQQALVGFHQHRIARRLDQQRVDTGIGGEVAVASALGEGLGDAARGGVA